MKLNKDRNLWTAKETREYQICNVTLNTDRWGEPFIESAEYEEDDGSLKFTPLTQEEIDAISPEKSCELIDENIGQFARDEGD